MVRQDIITASCARALIAPSHTVELHQSVAARNTGKVTPLLLLRTVGTRDNAQSSARLNRLFGIWQFSKRRAKFIMVRELCSQRDARCGSAEDRRFSFANAR
jgi:hypothetical protein